MSTCTVTATAPDTQSILLAARRDALRLAGDAAAGRKMMEDLEARARGQADTLAAAAAAVGAARAGEESAST